MARDEQDREDLLADAVALVHRAELRTVGSAESIVVGFRSNGCASVYFGADPAYHFNTRNQLRRAFVDGALYKAERGLLVALARQRRSDEVCLLRRDLGVEETAAFLAGARARLQQLADALAAGACTILGQVPPDADVTGRTTVWLDKLLGSPLSPAHRPHAR